MNPEIVIVKGGVRQAGASESGKLMQDLKIAAERNLYVFAKAIMGNKDLIPSLHGEVCKFMQRIPPRRKGVLMPRDTFKTTLAKALCVHITIQPEENNVYFPGMYGPDTRILYCAETSDRAETRVRYLKETYETNRLLRAFWPDCVWEDPAMVKAKWNQQRLLLPRKQNFDECTIERTGVDAAITGGHFDVFIKDDLIALRARQEESTMQRAIDWNHSSISLANGVTRYQEFYFGTRWGAWDLYTDVQDLDPEVEWYERRAIEDGKPIFPTRLPLEELQKIERRQGDLFYLNYMNTTAGSGLQDFNMKDVRKFRLEGSILAYDSMPVDTDLGRLFHGDSEEPSETREDAVWREKLRG